MNYKKYIHYNQFTSGGVGLREEHVSKVYSKTVNFERFALWYNIRLKWAQHANSNR